jgi:hypothetical protein
LIVAIPTEHIERLWPVIGVGVERCLAKGVGKFTAAEVRERVTSGHWLLFIVQESNIVKATIICNVEEGARRVFEVGMAWGNGLAEWSDDVDQCLTKVATELKCDDIVITGRRGWAKYLKNYGFSEAMITMKREI